MDLPKRIEARVRTNSKYGLVDPGDVLEVGTDIDERGAKRWLEKGLAKSTDLKKKREEPEDETLDKPDPDDTTVKEIKAYLDQEDIDYTSNMTKPELLALIYDES